MVTEEARGRAADVSARWAAVRRATLALAAPLSPEDAMPRSMPDASPAKWHLGHTTWFLEAFVLARAEPGVAPFHPSYAFLFNSYYEALGPRQPRPERGLLSRPALDEVLRYRAWVDERVGAVLAAGPTDDLLDLVELGVAHEEQHQELLLTDVKHAFSSQPLRPAYLRAGSPAAHPGRGCTGAAEGVGADGTFADAGRFHPAPARPGEGLRQLLGDVWEWTRSAYAPYPGYRPEAGALGEYNGKFMVSQLVLRGGSCATPPGHVRASYRNFFYPSARWHFSGVRLARDA